MKANHPADGGRELRKAETIEMLGRRRDAWREIVQRLIGCETQVVKGRGYRNRRIVAIRIIPLLSNEVPSVVINPVHMPPVPRVVRPERLPITIEHPIDEWRVFHDPA